MEFASSIPDGMKQNGREGKWICKNSMEAYLPKEIIYRPKTGFGTPIRHWLKSEASDYAEDLLGHSSLIASGLFDSGQVRKLVADNHSGTSEAPHTIFSLICIKIMVPSAY